MACPELAPRTFVLKYIRKAHEKEVKPIVEKVDGVKSVEMNIEECKAKISGTVEPVIVMKELQKHQIMVKLLPEESQPVNNHQEMSILLQQKSVPKVHDQLMVANQPGYGFPWIALALALALAIALVLALARALEAFLALALARALKAFPWITLALALKAVLDKLIGKSTSDNNKKHELELRSYNKRFTCDGCKEDGFGFRYRCKQCDYELHEECKVQKPIISPKLFQGSTFEFCQNSYLKGQERCCDACGKDIYGYSYHCEANDLDLHPRCCNLEGKLRIGGEDGEDFELCKEKLSKCMWCEKKDNSGTRGRVPVCYVCKCKNYQFHVYCITEMVHEAWKKGDADHTEDTSMALKLVDLKPMAKKSNRNGGRGSDIILKTLKIFIGTIRAVLLGDPTALLASTVVGLLSG